MAVILNPNQENQNQPQTGPNGQPLQTVGTAAPAGQAPSGTPMAASQANALAQQQRKGSGRFTNLQKYLQANQQGGQKVAEQVGQGMQKQFGQQTQEAQKYYNQLGQNIQQANQTAQQGQGFQQQLQGIGQQIGSAQQAGFDQRANQNLGSIEQFTQSPDFQRFQDIQAGRGIDENLLGLQQQRALTAAQQAAQGSQQAQQALSSEGGRFDLLRRTFGGDGRTNYTQGQQRLDQVLFGQGGGLGTLQSQASQQAINALAQQKLANASRGDVNRIIEQERGLISDIGTQTSANEQAYLNMLKSYIDPLNTQRQAEFDALNQSVQAYAGTPEAQAQWQSGKTTGFTQDQLARLGLTDPNQGVYNVFRAPGGVSTADDIAIKGQTAYSAQDVANQQDVARYQALAKMIGKDFVPQITQASQIGEAWKSKEGEAALSNRLAAAQNLYDKAARQNISQSTNFDTAYGTPEEILKRGYDALMLRSNGTGATPRSWTQVLSENRPAEAYWQANNIDPYMQQLQNFLNQQNYAQTIGGRRESFVDTVNAQRLADQGITPAINDQTPITQYDPVKKDINK